MKVECKDLDRILREEIPEEMAALEAHAESCVSCAEELKLWHELSAAAPSMQKQWESPGLWPQIRQRLAEEGQKPAPAGWRAWLADWAFEWRTAAAVVALMLVTSAGTWLVVKRTQPGPATQQTATVERRLLTEQALKEILVAETAYRNSIAKLEKVAEPQVERADSPLMMSYREKLVLLNAAIEELRVTAEQNPYNAHLRRELLALFVEKNRTLQEIANAAGAPR
jgi:hypothetical protein